MPDFTATMELIVKTKSLLGKIEMFRTNSFSYMYKQELDDAEDVLKYALDQLEGKKEIE